MYTLKCPHCESDIELLGQKDLTAQYRLTPNKVVRLLALEALPEAALAFENRRLWTRQQVDEFRAEQGKERVHSLLMDTKDALSALPEEERALFRSALLEATAQENRTPK